MFAEYVISRKGGGHDCGSGLSDVVHSLALAPAPWREAAGVELRGVGSVKRERAGFRLALWRGGEPAAIRLPQLQLKPLGWSS